MNEGYRDLQVWQRAMGLAEAVYSLTRKFPKDETYGLAAQLRRAAVSVPSNIAEGHGRNSKGEFHHFLGTSRGSLLEIETQVELSRRLGYITNKQCGDTLKETAEIGRMINGLRSWAASAADS